MMRTNDLMDPASWRAWNGSDYSVSFVSPYDLVGAGRHSYINICLFWQRPF
jgi:hypothetical protein